ncbi:MAG: NAD(P)/FAD-dependent oxidoreductase [Chloroflexi bacterium]|nr:NAD(P)/FAD-dependent oxidoreductase [Chloroflexota bacterium]
MPDATFDAVIIGAGHNGLCLAAYLAKAGLSVGIFERRHEDGGGANTEEATVPGFHHNLHGQYMEFIDYMPVYHDFELEKLGARMIYPEVQLGITFADGRPPIVIYRPGADLDKKTHKSIAHYSKNDADVWLELKHKVMERDRTIAATLYSPAEAEDDPQAAAAIMSAGMALWTDLGLKPNDIGKAPKVLIDRLFESTEMRTLLYRQCIEWGANVHAGNGYGFLISVLWLSAIHKMSVGGTHTLAHAMANACMKQGVCIRFTKPVVKIVMKNGRASGIQLKDGTEIEAKRLVASNVDPRQTFVDFIGEENLTLFRRERLAHWRFGPEHVLGVPSFALHEAPKYKSAKWNPDIDRCFYTLVGFEDEEQISNYILQAYGGAIPDRPGAGTWVNSLWDPTQAPPGKHAMNGWFFFPRASCLSPEEWDEVRATYNDRFLQLWSEYAPNMTRENVIADRLYTAFDIEKKIGMPEGDFSHGRSGSGMGGAVGDYQYRTEIPGLYLCGASAGGGGISAAPGYGAFKVICKDLELPKVWQQECRDY